MTSSTAQHSNRLLLRLANLDDAGVLLEWRNNSSTREASHNTASINEYEHIQWLRKILANVNRKLYVAEIDGTPVGTVRVDSDALESELSWTVSPAMRGSGVGKEMVSMLVGCMPEAIRAEIKTGNGASVRIAEEAGMAFECEVEGILNYRRAAVAKPINPKSAP
jgi:RimJ/RimL family protein N-acetyltransferase